MILGTRPYIYQRGLSRFNFFRPVQGL